MKMQGEKFMGKSIMLLIMLVMMLLLSACSENSSEDKTVKDDKSPQQLKADIAAPEEVFLNKETVLEVKVTQGKKAVDDADVKFKVWKGSNIDDSKMFDAEHVKEGTYKIKTSFSEDGIYYVQTHVTASDMYVMPITHILAGDVPEEELKALEESLDHDHGHQH
jgi:YtkA-like